jgi:hypothetical protein
MEAEVARQLVVRSGGEEVDREWAPIAVEVLEEPGVDLPIIDIDEFGKKVGLLVGLARDPLHEERDVRSDAVPKQVLDLVVEVNLVRGLRSASRDQSGYGRIVGLDQDCLLGQCAGAVEGSQCEVEAFERVEDAPVDSEGAQRPIATATSPLSEVHAPHSPKENVLVPEASV